jgi:hypothetical protein
MKKIYLTVDVECHDISRRNQYIEGKYKGGYCGLERILTNAKELNIPVNFFVDMVEMYEYGEDYVRDVIGMIKKYNQPIFLHLHPNYVSKDHSKKFLWQYSYSEKKDILKKSFALYRELLGEETKAFRVGCYGADADMYRIMKELNIKVVDLSYCYDWEKMCKLSYEDVGTKNTCTEFNNQIVFPNTRYKGFSFCGINKYFNLDVRETCVVEWKRYLNKNYSDKITLTMHSWNLMKKYFFDKKFVTLDKHCQKKMHKMVRFAQKKGYVFGNLYNENTNEFKTNDFNDEPVDLCKGIFGKALMLICNFRRFQITARLNKRYWNIYLAFYAVFAILLILLLSLTLL